MLLSKSVPSLRNVSWCIILYRSSSITLRRVNVFLISQLNKCHSVLTDTVDSEALDLQSGLIYEEYPIVILDRDERRVKRSMVKFVKVQWSNHTEDEATSEREDRLRQEYPEFFSGE